MLTIDRIVIRAPLERVFALARDVERWPELLPHYRWVRMLERRADGGRVEMAAWRPLRPPPQRKNTMLV
jgi:ribosome-associated toxin RatA of RatAB toxin-antitoxin module